MEFTDIEKKFLVMLFEMANHIFEAQDNNVIINHEFFTESDLYNLECKLGIQDDVY